MEIIKSNKGGLKLCAEGYMYTKKSENCTKVRWECSRRKALGCNGSVSTDRDLTQFSVISEHCHYPNPAAVSAAKLRCEMKSRALAGAERPGAILASVVGNEEAEVRMAVGKKDSTIRNLRRLCNAALPRDPSSLKEVHVGGEWATTGAPDHCPFLIYDNGAADAAPAEVRMLVFATPHALEHLCRSKTWYMDGTLPVSPGLCQQMYVIRAPLGTSAVACVYALLSRKTQTAYEELLQAVCETCDAQGCNPNPEFVQTDFEQGMIDAVRNILGGHIRVRCSFHHLRQNTRGKIQSLGLSPAYKDSKEFQHFCCMIDGLAFLPAEDVPEGLRYLEENVPDVPNALELLDYFKSTYVQGTYRGCHARRKSSIKLRKVPAPYPPHLWSAHEATLDGRFCRTDGCESWDTALCKSIRGCANPSIWLYIDAIRQDHNRARDDIFNDLLGEPPKKRARTATLLDNYSRLHLLCTKYKVNKLSISEFLADIGSCIRMKQL